MTRHPEQALRIVASKDGQVQGRIITNLETLLDQEVEAGHLFLPVTSATMAYALTRIVESFLYSDLIIGEAPELDDAAKILSLMLGQTQILATTT